MGLNIPSIAQQVRSSARLAIAESRALSRDAGIRRLQAEAASADVDALLDRLALRRQVVIDLARGHAASDSYARRWESKALGSSTAEAALIANAETDSALTRIAITESSEAFNSGRLAAARASGLDLFRRWDAQADACPVCAMADGKIVGVNEPFPEGEPGSVHPNCNCDWELISAEEAGEPSEEAA
jgi:hypothetical protein